MIHTINRWLPWLIMVLIWGSFGGAVYVSKVADRHLVDAEIATARLKRLLEQIESERKKGAKE